MRMNGTYMEEISKIPMLTLEEERELAEKAWAGDKKAQDRLVQANLKFVVSVAGKFKNCGLDMEDLICEGNAGLMTAARKFDPSRNVRFITYAVWWIRHSIQQAIYATGTSVKLPVSQKELFRSNVWKAASLDKKVSEDGDGTLQDIVADVKCRSPEEEYWKNDDRMKIRSFMDVLDGKERAVIEMRFGFGGEEPMSLSGVSEILGYTKEGVRKIEKRALLKLREVLEEKVVA